MKSEAQRGFCACAEMVVVPVVAAAAFPATLAAVAEVTAAVAQQLQQQLVPPPLPEVPLSDMSASITIPRRTVSIDALRPPSEPSAMLLPTQPQPEQVLLSLISL